MSFESNMIAKKERKEKSDINDKRNVTSNLSSRCNLPRDALLRDAVRFNDLWGDLSLR